MLLGKSSARGESYGWSLLLAVVLVTLIAGLASIPHCSAVGPSSGSTVSSVGVPSRDRFFGRDIFPGARGASRQRLVGAPYNGGLEGTD